MNNHEFDIYQHNKIAYGMNMKYCIIPGWSTLYTDFLYEISTCIIDSELHDFRYISLQLDT